MSQITFSILLILLNITKTPLFQYCSRYEKKTIKNAFISLMYSLSIYADLGLISQKISLVFLTSLEW